MIKINRLLWDEYILSSHLFQDEAAITNFQDKRARGENKRNEKIA
jgi:hypothetical protein